MTVSSIKRRPAAPAGLSAEEAALFDALVKDWPTGHFKQSDLALVGEYCRALAMADELGKQALSAAGMDDLKIVLDLRDREARRAAALARTLRLAPQSRYDRHASATAANKVKGSRPWEENPFAALDG